MPMVKALVQNFNGITMAYVMGFVNAALALLIAFGIHFNDQQQGAVITFVNAAMIVAVHLGHRLGEAAPTPLPSPVPNVRADNAPPADVAAG